jgi:hypothetical protein
VTCYKCPRKGTRLMNVQIIKYEEKGMVMGHVPFSHEKKGLKA